jgi:hypothetical protein
VAQRAAGAGAGGGAGGGSGGGAGTGPTPAEIEAAVAAERRKAEAFKQQLEQQRAKVEALRIEKQQLNIEVGSPLPGKVLQVQVGSGKCWIRAPPPPCFPYCCALLPPSPPFQVAKTSTT